MFSGSKRKSKLGFCVALRREECSHRFSLDPRETRIRGEGGLFVFFGCLVLFSGRKKGGEEDC